MNFKKDLQGDEAAKVKFIREHGYDAWAALPFDETSIGASRVVGSVIPSASMSRKEYLSLSVAERSKLTSEVGPIGIGKIMNRVTK